MEVSCPTCHRRYRIPDHKINNRSIFFFCEQCNEKITVQGSEDPWISYGGLNAAPFSVTSILEGIFLSFNVRNILLSFGMHACIFFCLLVGLFISGNHGETIHGHPVLRVLSLTLFAASMLFIFDLHLYLISKNVFARIEGGGDFSINEERSVFLNDVKCIFFVSALPVLLIGMLLLPIYPLDRFGLVYSGFVFSFLLALMVLLLFGILLKPMIVSLFAMKSRAPLASLRILMRFMAVENINLIVYGGISAALTALVSCCVIPVAAASIALLMLGIGPILGPSLLQEGGSMTLAMAMGQFFADRGSVGPDLSTGLLMLLVTGIVLGIIVIAFLCTVLQTLASVSVWIMVRNPGRSVNRRYLLIFMGLVVVAIILMALNRYAL